ncbi:MAG: anaerobic ribonucleoside-triphosphate reductase activating protein [Thermodesulfobacteriota bacterium]|nr:anaerobic ribonucleoside-triphosphate reductase activating protein [Thermodesulfobacteriota bacterium]
MQRFSLIDYPGKICAIIFTQGCNFRCPYCHNPELVNPKEFGECIAHDEIFSFLERRRGKLDAVSITGGEPTIQNDLVGFIKKIKDLGYLVKIDTNGTMPDILEELMGKKLLDLIAMDVKAPLDKYKKIVKASVDTRRIEESIHLIMNSGIDYEFRTTIVKSLLDEEDIKKIGMVIEGADCYILQKFVPSKTLNPKFMNEKTFTDEEFERTFKSLEKLVKSVIIR